MKKTWIIIILSFLLYVNQVSAQDTIPKRMNGRNAVYMEILGSSFLLYALTYDRIVYQKNNFGISGALGAQFIQTGWGMLYSTTTQVNLIWGHIHYLETGVGFTQYFVNHYCFPFRFGYRFQRDTRGFFFKLAFTPTIQKADFMDFHNAHARLVPWGGVSLGYSF
jgi:hypothetical protein